MLWFLERMGRKLTIIMVISGVFGSRWWTVSFEKKVPGRKSSSRTLRDQLMLTAQMKGLHVDVGSLHSSVEETRVKVDELQV